MANSPIAVHLPLALDGEVDKLLISSDNNELLDFRVKNLPSTAVLTQQASFIAHSVPYARMENFSYQTIKNQFTQYTDNFIFKTSIPYKAVEGSTAVPVPHVMNSSKYYQSIYTDFALEPKVLNIIRLGYTDSNYFKVSFNSAVPDPSDTANNLRIVFDIVGLSTLLEKQVQEWKRKNNKTSFELDDLLGGADTAEGKVKVCFQFFEKAFMLQPDLEGTVNTDVTDVKIWVPYGYEPPAPLEVQPDYFKPKFVIRLKMPYPSTQTVDHTLSPESCSLSPDGTQLFIRVNGVEIVPGPDQYFPYNYYVPDFIKLTKILVPVEHPGYLDIAVPRLAPFTSNTLDLVGTLEKSAQAPTVFGLTNYTYVGKPTYNPYSPLVNNLEQHVNQVVENPVNRRIRLANRGGFVVAYPLFGANQIRMFTFSEGRGYSIAEYSYAGGEVTEDEYARKQLLSYPDGIIQQTGIELRVDSATGSGSTNTTLSPGELNWHEFLDVPLLITGFGSKPKVKSKSIWRFDYTSHQTDSYRERCRFKYKSKTVPDVIKYKLRYFTNTVKKPTTTKYFFRYTSLKFTPVIQRYNLIYNFTKNSNQVDKQFYSFVYNSTAPLKKTTVYSFVYTQKKAIRVTSGYSFVYENDASPTVLFQSYLKAYNDGREEVHFRTYSNKVIDPVYYVTNLPRYAIFEREGGDEDTVNCYREELDEPFVSYPGYTALESFTLASIDRAYPISLNVFNAATGALESLEGDCVVTPNSLLYCNAEYCVYKLSLQSVSDSITVTRDIAITEEEGCCFTENTCRPLNE